MNILVVSKNFTKGGLETNIFTQYNIMKNKHKFVFAFGTYNSNLDFKDSKIYKDFCFTEKSTIEQFCLDVDRLVNIIKDEKIDVIHVHPFYSVFPAVFAAKLTNVKVLYTYHGYASFNFPYKVNDVILFQSMLESEIDKIFAVSKSGSDAINNAISSNKTVFLPNAVDVNKYKKHNVIENKVWALISRLQNEKIDEIKKIISVINQIDINKICIYGDGNKKEELQNFIKSNNLEDKIELMGHSDNLYEELDGKYNGIIGIGRVALEALSMGYPTILIGYGKVAGIIDFKLYNHIKEYNFVNRMLPDINIEVLKSQIEQLYKYNEETNQIYNDLRKEFSAEIIYEKYEQEINNVQILNKYNFQKIYNEIKTIDDVNDNIYDSRLVYNILKKYIEPVCLSINLKNYFISFNNYFNILDMNYKEQINIQNELNNIKDNIDNIKTYMDIANNRFTDINSNNSNINNNINIINNNISNIKNEIEDLKQEQVLLLDKINIKFLTYNTFKKVKNKKKE